MDKPVVALVDSTADLRDVLREILLPGEFKLIETESGPHLFRDLRQENAKLAIIPVAVGRSPGGLETASRIRQHGLAMPLILVAIRSSEDQVIAALRVGANDYIKWPCTDSDMLASVRRTLASPRATALRWRRSPSPELSVKHSLTGQSEAMCEVRDYVRSASQCDSNVLISGETGTGKERVAQSLHAYSHRRDAPLVCINCAAVPESLLESELFGHEKGAFTGANSAYEGKLKLANGGTVFLDEIGDMTPLAQTKILRAIETKQVYPLGGRKGISLDVRLAVATNRNLERMVEAGTFREDLYYRLNVLQIQLPPLRERKEDIPLLAREHLRELNNRFNADVDGLADDVMELFLRHDWPGNIRELRNTIEAALIGRPKQRIQVADLPQAFFRKVDQSKKEASYRQAERDVLLATLMSTNWNKTRAARKLKWSRMTVYRKMRQYHIHDVEPL